jgi:hypothetical protein
MNPFMLLGALLCFGASGWACWHHDWTMAVMYAGWGVADFAVGLKG